MTATTHGSVVVKGKRKISSKTIAPRAHKPKKVNRHSEPTTQRHCREKKLTGTVCCLCGEHIPAGKLLVHKEQRHGERIVTQSPVYRHVNTWVRVVQGGLPGLGRRH
jgi:hypothetical protein